MSFFFGVVNTNVQTGQASKLQQELYLYDYAQGLQASIKSWSLRFAVSRPVSSLAVALLNYMISVLSSRVATSLIVANPNELQLSKLCHPTWAVCLSLHESAASA